MPRFPRPSSWLLLFLAAAPLGAQSLYVDGVDPYGAVRRFQPGDLIQITVDENMTAERDSQQAVNKQTSINASYTNGTLGTGPTTQLSLGQGGSGSGTTKKSDQFTATISVRVTAVEPDGTLDVKGEQLLDLDGETQKLTLSGQLNPQDVGLDRTADSHRLAGAEIHLTNKGTAARGGTLGWLNWILSWIGL